MSHRRWRVRFAGTIISSEQPKLHQKQITGVFLQHAGATVPNIKGKNSTDLNMLADPDMLVQVMSRVHRDMHELSQARQVSQGAWGPGSEVRG